MAKLIIPAVPSALILAALEDIEWVEADPRYIVDMGEWHSPVKQMGGGTERLEHLADKQGKHPNVVECAVCPCGAMMARRLGTPTSKPLWPGELKDPSKAILLGLDELRTGDIYGVYSNWGIEDETEQDELIARLRAALPDKGWRDSLVSFDFPIYDDDPIALKQVFCEVAGVFREMGL